MTIDPELLTGLGAALSIFLTATGSAIASAQGGVFALRQKDVRGLIPIVQAGVLSIYGIIIAIILCGKLNTSKDVNNVMTAVDGYRNLSAGLSVGLGVWASGYGMSIFLRQINQGAWTEDETADKKKVSPKDAVATEPELPFKKLILVMIFLEAIGLYGLVVALFLTVG